MFKKLFLNWFDNEFNNIEHRVAMETTVEDSPYHREANVWVHTQMVVQEYVDMSPDAWDRKDVLGALMCAFHDVGKPMSEEELTRDNGTTYRRYTNHDTMSGNLWMDYYLRHTDNDFFTTLGLTDDEVYNIWVMIAYHMPYKLKGDRLKKLKFNTDAYGITEVFCRGVYADACGRTSDDPSKTRGRSKEWCDEFMYDIQAEERQSHSENEVILLVGCSGVGKSTYVQNNLNDDVAYHSMDQLRLDWYSSDYTKAFELASDDKNFSNNVAKHFAQCLAKSTSVAVDNTNLTWKRRNSYIANSKGATTKAVVFSAPFSVVADQQNARTDKYIPINAVKRMYYSLRPPILGEVNSLETVFRKV